MAKKFREETVESSLKYYQKIYRRLLAEGLEPGQAQMQAIAFTSKRALRYGAVLLLKKIAQKLARKYDVPRQEVPIVYAFVNEVAKALMEMGDNEPISEVVAGIYKKHTSRLANSVSSATTVIDKLYDWLSSIDNKE
jgi:hypothetical protein